MKTIFVGQLFPVRHRVSPFIIRWIFYIPYIRSRFVVHSHSFCSISSCVSTLSGLSGSLFLFHIAPYGFYFFFLIIIFSCIQNLVLNSLIQSITLILFCFIPISSRSHVLRFSSFHCFILTFRVFKFNYNVKYLMYVYFFKFLAVWIYPTSSSTISVSIIL